MLHVLACAGLILIRFSSDVYLGPDQAGKCKPKTCSLMLPLNRELIPLSILFLIALMISTLLPQLLGGQDGHISIQLANRPMLISPLAISPLVFVPLVFIVYLIKEWHYGYQRDRQRQTLILFNSLLLIGLTMLLIFSKLIDLIIQSILAANPDLKLPKIIVLLVEQFPSAIVLALFGICLASALTVSILAMKKS